jgi:hypothetical protein
MLEPMEQPVTIFRSADEDAEDDAMAVVELLKGEGIKAALIDDSAPGVPEGAWEVRVASVDGPRAEALVAAQDEESEEIDESPGLDLVTVFETGAGSTEMDAQSIKNVLEANGIEAVIVGGTPIPSTGQEVQVAREDATEARQVIADALAAGPTAADEGEAATER